MFLISSLVILVCPIVGMVFFTLLERKLIGYVQLRVGPNKVSWSGLFQAFLDAVKLLLKAVVRVSKSNTNLYFTRPIVGLALALFMWGLYPNPSTCVSFSAPLFLCISRLGVYRTLGAG